MLIKKQNRFLLGTQFLTQDIEDSYIFLVCFLKKY